MNLKTAVFFGKIMQNRRQKFLEPHASYTTTITKTASFYPNKEVCFVAKRNIEEGDELTIDYGEGSGKTGTYKLLNKIVKVSIFCNFSSYFHIFAAVGWTFVMFYIWKQPSTDHYNSVQPSCSPYIPPSLLTSSHLLIYLPFQKPHSLFCLVLKSFKTANKWSWQR